MMGLHLVPFLRYLLVALSLLVCAKADRVQAESRSYSTAPETEPPRYVRTLSETGVDAFSNLDWLDAGLDHRVRYEWREGDFRRAVDTTDRPLLFRTRAYLGVHDILDPLRLVAEFEDARREHSQFAGDDRDINKLEFIQAYAELYDQDGMGLGVPVALRAGRMAFEVLDRRLIGRNEWRNTTNNFQGFRLLVGEKNQPWRLDLMALEPLTRELESTDHREPDSWLYGAILDWNLPGTGMSLQPYYFHRWQHLAGGGTRRVHSPGVRVAGVLGLPGWDYDTSLTVQWGDDGAKRHRALATTTEIGYQWSTDWQPRLSGFYGYGSGDDDPNDQKQGRFDRLFGFARPWSANDYVQWENIHALKGRLELTPHADWRLDGGLSSYWLASQTDRWNAANLQDATGSSGRHLGDELDLRARYRINGHLQATLGYSHFQPGQFARQTGRDESSDFVYLEWSFSWLE